MGTASIAKLRLQLVLADDHGRGTRALTWRDVTIVVDEDFDHCSTPPDDGP